MTGPGRLGPNPDSERLLKVLVRRSKRDEAVQLAVTFVRGTGGEKASWAQMLRGGGEVRIKVYLTVVLLAVGSGHKIRSFSGPSVAQALGLPDPSVSGARRVTDALRWLDEHSYIRLDRQPGRPTALELLAQDLSGGPYERPTPRSRYVKIPLGLWDQQWITALSGAGLALLVVLIDLQSGRKDARPVYLSARLRAQYSLSPDTWTRGRHELERAGLLAVGRTPQGPDFDYRRMRNTYRILTDQLNEPVPLGFVPVRGALSSGRRIQPVG